MAVGIGITDDFYGEVGCFFIVPKPGTQPTEQEIKEFCKKNLADYKVPKQIVFVETDQIPFTASGKAQKVALIEMFLRNKTI